jgi:Leucine-rich repeat (LRR) protein
MLFSWFGADVSLPSALFEIHSLTSLTLSESVILAHETELMEGSNRLTRLPAAIGELHNLKELNIGNNKIVRS